MGQIQWTVSIALVALFSVAISGFAANFAADNSSPIDISDDPELSSANAAQLGELDNLKTGLTSTTNSIINSSVSSEGFTTESSGQFSITAGDLVSIAKNTMQV